VGHAQAALAAATLLFGLPAVAPPAAAQEHAHSPYAGLETRPVKALSEERRAGLEKGEGLGYAMAAELNGHAGPKHVLEMADELGLSAEQRNAIEASYEKMHRAAVELGGEIIAREEMLDRRFAHRHLDDAVLLSLTGELGRLEGELRFTHLRAHLETDAVLTAAQRAKYVELRGYGEAVGEGHARHGH